MRTWSAPWVPRDRANLFRRRPSNPYVRFLHSMRITLATALVLQAIARGHRYGFEIVDVTGYPTGTVYPALRRLEAAGYLRSAWENERVAFGDARPQRRYYEVTAAG